MSELVRLGISLERSLLTRLDRLAEACGYNNRSAFVRDMVRERLVEQQWADRHQEVVGTITIIYDHHARQLADRLIEIQHSHHDEILAATHVHLSHELCAEMIMVKGQADTVRHLADSLRQQRGVLHATLSMSSTGQQLR